MVRYCEGNYFYYYYYYLLCVHQILTRLKAHWI